MSDRHSCRRENRSVRRRAPIRGAAAALLLTLSLTSCYLVDNAEMAARVVSAASSDETYEKEVAAFATDPARDTDWGVLLGEAILYLPDDYKTSLTRDRDTFYGSVVGAYLAQTNLSAAMVNDALKLYMKLPPVPEQQLEMYKLSGQLWLDRVMAEAEGGVIQQRYALFRKRIGSAPKYNYTDLRDLLWDEAALDRFLRDDEYAATWLFENSPPEPKKRYAFLLSDLKPITIPVLPGTGS